MTRLAGSTVLITGASTGIGAATAREMGRRGARVLLVARSEGPLRELAEEIGLAQTGTAATVNSALQSAGLPTALPPGSDGKAVIEAMRSDKKGRSGRTRFALPLRIGEMAGADSGWTVSVSDDQLREVLA